MVAKSVKWALAGLMAGPSAAMALGLGDIHLNSTLNAPLDASIDLVGATSDELATLTPKIASRDTFAQHGLDWPAFLSNVTVRAVHTASGHDVLELRSLQPVTEPFLTLLVELDWDRGHFVREYTVLLDPPVYTPNAGRVAREPVEAPTTGTAANEGTIQRGTEAPAAAASSEAATSAAATAPPAGAPAAVAPAASAAPAPGAAPSGSEGSSAGSSQASGSTPAAGAGAAGEPSTYTVRSGDSLSRIALKTAARSDEYRWMVATYQANPEAFDRNMNQLRSGAVLRIPSESAVDAITAAQASIEVHRQYAAWRGSAARTASTGEQPGRLHLVAPGAETGNSGAASVGEGAGAGTSGAGAAEKSLQGEVQSLQAQLDESRRLIDLKNAELAQLQAKLAAQGSAANSPSSSAASAGAESASSAAVAAQPAPGSEAQQSATPPAAVPAQAPQATATNAPAAAKVVRRPVIPASAPPPAPESSWLGSLGSLSWVLAAAAVALLGLLGFRAWNARRKAGFDDSLGRLAEAGGSPHSGTPPLGNTSFFGGADEPEDALPRTAPQMAPRRESSFLVEESGTHERARVEETEAAPAARHVEAGDAMSGETAINLDQGDPLAEADFHMAYGLYDQAADLVRIAIQREPERRDLKLKLLEVFFVWGNKEQFLATARDLAQSRTAAAPGEWEKIVIMGKQLAPEDPLFASGAGVSGAAAGGVDLDLQGGEQVVDFDVLGTQSSPAAEGVDLDIGSAIGERDPAAEAAAQRATDRNLALDETLAKSAEVTAEREVVTATQRMLGADGSTGSTREMTARTRELTGVTREMTATIDRDAPWASDAATEAPTVEQPALRTAESPGIRQKVEMALRAGATEHTAEVALDDLGLDLTALAPAPDVSTRGHEVGADHGAAADHETTADGDDGANHVNGANQHDTIDQPVFASGPDSPTMVAGLDEHSRRLMEAAGRGSGASELKVSETGTWHFDEDPLNEGSEATLRTRTLAADLSETSRLAALKSGTVDFEIGEPTQITRANGAGPVDLDVGTATVPDVVFTKTQRLGTDDLALPDLDPVTMSEVGTKLDLARAYMDMGDPEGARNILEEVLNEGSVVQRQEAERLIASLPG
jgi:pilus assembly protein FimV